MRTERKTKALRLEFFKGLYESALLALGDSLEAFERNMSQYRGSTKLDGTDTEAITVRNVTYEIIESQISSEIPQPKADAASYSERRARNAEAIERLCRSVRDRLPFEELNDIDERYTYIYGGSVWYVDWDSSLTHTGEVGGIRVHCLSPRDFIPQPGIYNIEDMDYCFLRFTSTRSELARKYGKSEEELKDAECEYSWQGAPDESDAVNMTVCFYKDEDGEVGRFIFSGDVILSDLERYYMRKGDVCCVCGRDSRKCSCKKPSIVFADLTYESIKLKKDPRNTENIGEKLDTGEEFELKIPYYVPRVFPIVIRKNTSSERALLGQSDCEYIRPEQQAINKLESRILEKLLRAGVTPIVPEDARVTLNNSVFGQVIKMKPGESAQQYGKVDTTPDVTQDIREAERLYDHAKRIIGISDAYQGLDTNSSESGLSRQLRISQASGRLESKKKMKYTAYAAIDKLIFLMHLAFADEPRRLSYKDAYGRLHYEEFTKYDFIEYDTESCEYYYDDDYLFSVDLNGGSEYQREALWQRNLENLKAGTLGNPESPITLLRYWQCQERAHYPHARENVEYFKDEIDRQIGGGAIENQELS